MAFPATIDFLVAVVYAAIVVVADVFVVAVVVVVVVVVVAVVAVAKDRDVFGVASIAASYLISLNYTFFFSSIFKA